MTKDEILIKARLIHGWKYDYSGIADAQRVHDKVSIICPKHGEFKQILGAHLNGAGCPACKRVDNFFEKAHEIHGDKYCYDYDSVNNEAKYNTFWARKIKITCPEHGPFWQLPGGHLSGCGCPECGNILRTKKRSLTISEFIDKAKEIHNNKYDYSKTEYINNHTKVCIICPEHGEFWQKPNAHLSGNGCPECAKEKSKKTTKQFIDKAQKIHGNKYDYSKTEYVNYYTKVCIICPEHGEFWQTPTSHLNGCGCPKCVGKNKTAKDFIEKARKVHGDKFDYSKVNYINSYTKVCIICPEHGEFWQRPDNHLAPGFACPECRVRANHRKVAERYKNLRDYKNEHYTIYMHDVKHGYIDEYVWMDKEMNDGWGRDDNTSKIRCIYAYEFSETKTVYVGLTKNKRRRHLEHTSPKYNNHTKKRIHNPVYDYMEQTGLEPVLKYYEEGLTKNEAIHKERERSQWYESMGWRLLNIAPCGSLGGHKALKELTPLEIIEEAHKYSTPAELNKVNPYAIKKMWEYGISRECFPNIIHRKKCVNRKRPTEVRRYTPDLLNELCSKYACPQEIKGSDDALYMYLRKHNLIYEYFPDYNPGKRVKKRTAKTNSTRQSKYGSLTKEKFIDTLQSKYGSRADLKKRNGCLFKWAKENRGEWLDECFPPKETTPYQNRTKSDFEVICAKFKNRTELRSKNECLYIFLRDHRKEWLDEFLPSKNNRNF